MQTLNWADWKLKIAFESGRQKESENEFILDSYQEWLDSKSFKVNYIT